MSPHSPDRCRRLIATAKTIRAALDAGLATDAPHDVMAVFREAYAKKLTTHSVTGCIPDDKPLDQLNLQERAAWLCTVVSQESFKAEIDSYEVWEFLRQGFDSDDSVMQTERLGKRFRLGAFLAAGGQAIVYRGYDTTNNDREIALKFFRYDTEADCKNYKSELDALQRLSELPHPNVIQIVTDGHGFWRNPAGVTEHCTDERYFIALEFVPDSLKELLLNNTAQPNQPPLAFREASRIVSEVGRALCHAHTLKDGGVIHLDLKTSNVLLTKEGTTKLTDFGLAMMARDGGAANVAGDVGTDKYMAPEQVTGGRVRTFTDVHGAGVLLFECLTGKLPFEGLKDNIREQIKTTRAPRPSGIFRNIPAELDTICARCLAKNPRNRPSMYELQKSLIEFSNNNPISLKPYNRWQQFDEWRHRNPLQAIGRALAVCLVVVIVLLGVVVVLLVIVGFLAHKSLLAERVANSLSQTVLVDQAASSTNKHNPATAVFQLIRALEIAPASEGSGEQHLRAALASNAASLNRLQSIVTVSANIRGVAVSPNGQSVAFATDDGVLVLYDWNAGVIVNTRNLSPPGKNDKCEPLKDSLAAAAFSPNGSLLLVLANSGRVHVLNSTTLKEADPDKPPLQFSANGLSMAVSSTGNRVAVGGREKDDKPQSPTLVVFDYVTRKEVMAPVGVPGNVAAVAYSPDGKWLAASGHRDNKLHVWKADTGVESIEPIVHAGPIFAIAFSQDSTRVITGGIDRTVRFWGATDGKFHGLGMVHSHTHTLSGRLPPSWVRVVNLY